MGTEKSEHIWIVRDYAKCSGCRLCEIICSLSHEGVVWPEASRIHVYELFPGINVPIYCVQCDDYPCINACPTKALSVNKLTGAVEVDKEKCIACRKCTLACPGNIPKLHPVKKYILICDLCSGNPKCVEVCNNVGFHALKLAPRRPSSTRKTYAQKPEVVSNYLLKKVLGA